MTCIAIVDGCVDCARSYNRDHAASECDDLCRYKHDRFAATPELHDAYHQAQRCRKCGIWCAGREAMTKCPAGSCAIFSCPDCGEFRGSNGPIGCPHCSPVGWLGYLMSLPLRLWARIRGAR